MNVNNKVLPEYQSHLKDKDLKQQKSKKQKIAFSLFILIILISITIIIIVVKHKENNDTPQDFPKGYNPYIVDQQSQNDELHVKRGVIYIQNKSKIQYQKHKAQRFSDAKQIGIQTQQIPLGNNNKLIQNISYEIGQMDFKTSYMVLTDKLNERWSPPAFAVSKGSAQQTMRLDMNGFKLNFNPFSFSFSSTRSQDVLVTTEDQTFYMTDKFIQMDFKLPSQRVYGLGERNRKFNLEEGTWTMWANGQESKKDDGSGSLQGYGVHPFVLVQCKEKTEFFGIFFRNSNAQSPIVTFNNNLKTSLLSYITTGGTIEIYFFSKGTAKDIIASYQRFIGLSQLPPLWSLGWHASSKTYTNLSSIQSNVQKYNESGIPLEGVWIDKYYMRDYIHFTVDSNHFQNLSQFQQTLQSNGQKLILVVGPGLSNVKSDQYVQQAINKNCLIMANNNQPLESKIWGNSTYFIDFFNSNCSSLWQQGLLDLYSQVAFDGLWLDLNEPTTSCNGAYPCCPINESEQDIKTIENMDKIFEFEDFYQWYSSYNDQSNISSYMLPFIPSNKWNLDNMTLSLNATHFSTGYKQYDTHSLYGHMQAKATSSFFSTLKSKDQRYFLFSRSTFAGSGKYANHWLGENHRSFDDMKLSIAGIMNYNLFGIPFVGANVCGFIKQEEDNEDELCGRWFQLSTFYPFARIDGDDFSNGLTSEPYNLNEKYKSMAQKSIQERFKFMRFIYTCLFRASQEGRTCFDPLLYHYPEVDQVYQDIEHTFIVGDALKVSPVVQHLENDQQTYQVFFPKGEWVSLKNYSDIIDVQNDEGKFVNLQAPNDTINVHLRPGFIVPIQETTRDGRKFNLTSELRNNPISLIANRDSNKHSQGQIFLDKDDSISAIQNKNYEYYEFHLQNNSLIKYNLNSDNREYQGTDLLKLVITNAEDLSDIDTACVIYENHRKILSLARPQYDKISKTLTVMADQNDSQKTIQMYQMQMIHFSNSNRGINLCKQENRSRYYWKTQLDLSKFESSSILSSRTEGLPDLKFTAKVLQSGILSLYWTFNDYSQLDRMPFEVPLDILNGQKDQVSVSKNLSNYIVLPAFNQTEGPLLTVVCQQFNQNITIYQLTDIILSEYLNMIDGRVNVSNGKKFNGIMGLAERVQNGLFLGDGVYSLWSRDQPDPVETGQPPGNNMYGTHPFYMARAKDDSWFGVFTNLANAQDWWISNDKDLGSVNVTCFATGGVADLYIMFGQDPNEVTKQYHQIVGKPVLTPQWALGWHQSRWGYNSTEKLKEVVKNYTDNNIPLDTIWSDIDYMNNYQDFTMDQQNFKDLPDFVKSLHQSDRNLHYIPIIDAGIALRLSGYEAYKDGVQKNIFIKTYDNSEILTGQVWPVDAVFPDFFNPDAIKYWQYWIEKLYQEINFDGLWQDMNEIANFCQGVCYESQASPFPLKYKLPYVPTGRDLESKSLPLEGTHFGGIKEIDAHSLFGTQQTKASHEWFQSKKKRTMIIQRSAFSGLGKFGSRWLGDNFSQNEYMGYSVTGIMMHNILGIPLAGSDICGFMLNTTAELCARWHVVGSFYPFSRNHNGWNSISQEPYVFTDLYSENISYMDIMRNAIRNKYHLIRYYYTQMSLISQEGGAFYKPLFFEFPNDQEAYKNEIYNVMLGNSMKLSVQSNTNQNNTYFYFPEGTWCQIFNTSAQNQSCIASPQNGTIILLETQVFQFYLHLRNGHIVPMQNATFLNVLTSKDLQKYPIDLHINPLFDEKTGLYKASGTYLNDDGEILDVNGFQNIYQFMYQHQNNSNLSLQITQTKTADLVDDLIINSNDYLNRVEIYNSYGLNLTSNYSIQVNLNNGSSFPFKNLAMYNQMNQRLELQFDYQISLTTLKEIEFICNL